MVDTREALKNALSRYGKLFLSLAISRILSLGLSVLVIWQFAKKLGPLNLGISGLVNNLAALALLFGNLNHSTCLIYDFKLAETEAERGRVVVSSMVFRAFIALVCSVFISLFFYFRGALGSHSELVLYLIPLALLQTVSPLWLFQALERQAIQAWFSILTPGLSFVIFWGFTRKGAQTGDDLRAVLISTALVHLLLWSVLHLNYLNVAVPVGRDWWQRGKKLVMQSRWLFLGGLAGYLYLMFEEPLIGYMLSLNSLGAYRVAKYFSDGFGVIIALTSVIAFPRYIEWKKHQPRLYFGKIRQLAWLAMGFVLILDLGVILVIPRLFLWIFGAPYESAKWACAALMIAKSVTIVSNILAWGLLADPTFYRRVSLVMIGAAVLSLASNYLLLPKIGIVGGAISMFIAECFNLGFYYFSVNRAAIAAQEVEA